MTFLDSVPVEVMEDDPYPVFARMRRECPVGYYPPTDQWVVATWDGCAAVGTADPGVVGATQRYTDAVGTSVLNADGALHRWLRGGIDPPLRPKAVRGYIETVTRPVAVRYIEQIRPHRRMEATGMLFERISVRVVGDVLGLRDVDDQTRRRWFHAIGGGISDLRNSTQVRRDAEQAVAELDAAMTEHIERVTARPDGSGLSSMVHDGLGGGPPRTYDDLKGTIRIIITGGFQEPGHALAATVLGLMTRPGQYAELAADPAARAPKAVHEGLRWLPPFSVTERRALAEVDVHAATIPAGAEISLALASANRDETRWERADQFDMNRPRLAHAAFGYGAHFCAGHVLSRRMEEIVLEELARRIPELRLDPADEPRVSGYSMRGVKHLPLVW
jgi:aromatic O-demethylase, cytochrome P450 subunit